MIISDSKGNKFIIIKDKKNGVVYLYPEKVLTIPEQNGTSSFIDLNNAILEEKNISIFNYEHSML